MNSEGKVAQLALSSASFSFLLKNCIVDDESSLHRLMHRFPLNGYEAHRVAVGNAGHVYVRRLPEQGTFLDRQNRKNKRWDQNQPSSLIRLPTLTGVDRFVGTFPSKKNQEPTTLCEISRNWQRHAALFISCLIQIRLLLIFGLTEYFASQNGKIFKEPYRQAG